MYGSDASGRSCAAKIIGAASKNNAACFIRFSLLRSEAVSQITLKPEIQKRARQRAADPGISLAEYVRRVVERDLGGVPAQADPALVFDLGRSGGSDVARNKDAMIADAVASTSRSHRR